MNPTKPVARFLFILVTSMFPVLGQAGDCTQAQALFDKAISQGHQQQWQSALSTINQSIEQCERFENWYMAGQIQLNLDQYEQAVSAFNQARNHSRSDQQSAVAIARYAEAVAAQGHLAQAQTLIHQARLQTEALPTWVHQLAKRVDQSLVEQPLSIADITQALDDRAFRNLKINARPALSMRLNFEHDSTTLIQPEQFDPKILAQALSDPHLSDKTFNIIGHTDTTGESDYNQGLSIARARSIYQAIVAEAPSLKDRISVIGRGESDPLYAESGDIERMLNRRIELGLE